MGISVVRRYLPYLRPYWRLVAVSGVCGLASLVAAAEFGFTFTRRHTSGRASYAMEADMRNEFYAHLQGLRVSFQAAWLESLA